MSKIYQDGSSIRLRHSDLVFEIETEVIMRIHASFSRNMERVLSLLEIYESVRAEFIPVVLASVVISTMTAYECVVEDLLRKVEASASGKVTPLKPGAAFIDRRNRLLKYLVPNWKENGAIRRELSTLECLIEYRNCLTHRAGLADEKFLRCMATHPPLCQLNIGDPIILEHSLATSFANALQIVGLLLLKEAERLVAQLS